MENCMKKFKEFINEKVEDFYRGKKLITTDHYYDQIAKRDNDHAALKHIFRKAVDHLKINDYGDQDHFLFYSKKHNQAIAFRHKQNSCDLKDKRKHLVATTIFPKGDKYANPDTTLVNVEGFSPQFIEYIDLFIPEDVRAKHPLSAVMVENVEFYFLHGELHNIPFTEFLEVE